MLLGRESLTLVSRWFAALLPPARFALLRANGNSHR